MAGSKGQDSGLVTALIYTRVSTDEQARDGLSLDAQIAETRRYAAAKDGWVMGAEYQDVLKGTRDDRPAYQQLLTDVRRLRAEGRRVAVVVSALDRFGRAILERVRSREELKALGVPTHSVREGGEVSDIVANVLAAVAQEEVRRLGERVSAVRAHLGSTGWKFPGISAWGYHWRPSTEEERRAGAPSSVLEIDPVTAPFVQEAFRRVADGQSVREVARWVAGLPSEARSDRLLNYSRIRDALSAPVYVARADGHPESDILSRPRCRWPALISDELYARVQGQIAAHKRMPRQASGSYLLSGLLRCPRCGGRVSGAGSRRGVRRYGCKALLSRGAGATDAACTFTVNEPTIDAIVLSELERRLEMATTTDPSLHSALRRAWETLRRQPDDADGERRIRYLEQAADRARERLKRAALLFVDGQLDKAGYDLARAEAERDLDAADTELTRRRVDRAPAALPPLETVLRAVGSWRTVLREGSPLDRRVVLGTLIEMVIPQHVGWNAWRTQITWTSTGEALAKLTSPAAAAA